MRSGAQKKYNNKKRIIITAACIVLLAAIALAAYFAFFRGGGTGEPDTGGAVVVRVLDVGQGDSILITAPGNNNILIDTGPYSSQSTVISQLRQYGVVDIEYLVLTHPHGDHIGNAAEILRTFKTKNVVMTEAAEASYSYGELIDELEKQTGVNVIEGKAGLSFAVSGVGFRILSSKMVSDDLNESSIVMRMTYGENSMIFMGDAGETAEEWLMRNYTAGELKSDVIKIGHHGSKNSSTRTFLKTVSPRYAAISCGKDNDYGHPHSRVTDTLTSLGAIILRTDLYGTLNFYFYGDKVTTAPER